MKKTTIFLKNNFRLVLFAAIFAASSLLVACGESTESTPETDTVTATEPMIDTAAAPIDTAAADSGRAIMDPVKPESANQ